MFFHSFNFFSSGTFSAPQQASGTDQAETVEEATGMDAAEDDHI